MSEIFLYVAAIAIIVGFIPVTIIGFFFVIFLDQVSGRERK